MMEQTIQNGVFPVSSKKEQNLVSFKKKHKKQVFFKKKQTKQVGCFFF